MLVTWEAACCGAVLGEAGSGVVRVGWQQWVVGGGGWRWAAVAAMKRAKQECNMSGSYKMYWEIFCL